MALVVYFSVRTWEGFEKTVEEGAVGGGRKWMCLLTLQESSKITEYGAEVVRTDRKPAGSPSPLGTNQFCNHLPTKHSKMFESEFPLIAETMLKTVFWELGWGMEMCWGKVPSLPVPRLSLVQNPSPATQQHALPATSSVPVAGLRGHQNNSCPQELLQQRGDVQGFWDTQCYTTRERAETAAEHQAQQQLGFQRLKSQSMYKPEFLSIPSPLSPCFLPVCIPLRKEMTMTMTMCLRRHSKNIYAKWINILLIEWLSYFRDSFQKSWTLLLGCPSQPCGSTERCWDLEGTGCGRCSPGEPWCARWCWMLSNSGPEEGGTVPGRAAAGRTSGSDRAGEGAPVLALSSQQQLQLMKETEQPTQRCFPPKPTQIQEMERWELTFHPVPGAVRCSPPESLPGSSFRASLPIWSGNPWYSTSGMGTAAVTLPAVASPPSWAELGCQELCGASSPRRNFAHVQLHRSVQALVCEIFMQGWDIFWHKELQTQANIYDLPS